MGKSNQYRNLIQSEKNRIFIEKAKQVYGDNRFDYSKTNYIDMHTKICVTCPKHGDFYVLPQNFLRGHACKKCTQERLTSNTEDFIEKVRKVHGDKYDYSKVEYKGNNEKVCVICPKHGEFWIRPRNLLSGQGCRACGFESMREKQAITNEKFIEATKKCHTVDYDYSKVNYKGSDTPVCIICPKHGEFWMTPHQFLRGSNCPMCSSKHKRTTEEFIELAKDTHGGKYDYSNVEYVNNQTPVTIICPKHGEFQQLPVVHLQGCGCPKCGATFCNTEIGVLEKLKEVFPGLEYQKKFEFLKVKNVPQRIDFYLPDRKIAIEYQGRQHFQPVGIFGGDDAYEKTKERDIRKYKLCIEHGIKMYYISFENIYTNTKDLIEGIKKQPIVINEQQLRKIIKETIIKYLND